MPTHEGQRPQERNDHLLDVRSTLGELSIVRSQLQNLYPHMHVLNIPLGNRRFPSRYIDAYTKRLAAKDQRPTIRTMSAFSHTHYAETLIELEKADLEARLHEATEDGHIAVIDVAAVLNVGRMTVNHWLQPGILDLAPVTGQRRLYVTAESLQEACTWQEPTEFSQ